MIAVCLKWADHRPDVDPLTGAVHTDPRSSGASDADLAALEWALRLAEAWGDEVVAVTAGPPGADAVLRVALAVGAGRAVRAGVAADVASEDVAAALVAALGVTPAVVVCGAWSVDRGSGSVPAYLAAHLGAAQALGLVSMTIGAGPGELQAERRLDGGRRERLRVPTPAVLSVEGGSAPLRRAPLGGVLRARAAAIRAYPVAPPAHREGPVLAAPSGETARERVLTLTGAMVERRAAQTLFLPPPDAAREILDRLRTWGYLQ